MIFLGIGIAIWIAGFGITHLAVSRGVNLSLWLDEPVFYGFILLFFLGYALFTAFLFKSVKVQKKLSNYLSFGTLTLMINFFLDIYLVFPRYPEIKFMSYPVSYLGYFLMFAVPLALFFISRGEKE